MKQLIGLMVLLSFTLVFLGCEEEIPDYAGDIINTYIVESMTVDGENFVLTEYAPEYALFIKINRDNTQLFANSEDFCDENYQIETDEIDGVTETAILYMDGSSIDYRFEGGNLIIEDGGDVIILSEYGETFPPPVWTDPSLLTNDTYEPNDISTMATAIAAGGTVQNHYLARCNDVDYFVFTAISGTTYFLGTTTVSGSPLDLTLTLYSGAGEQLAYSDDYYYGGDLNPGLDWICPRTGDYYFMVKGFWDNDYGNYSVFVNLSTGLLKPAIEPQDKQPVEPVSDRARKAFFH